MLRPSKHSHPDRTVINIALFLVTWLKSHRVEDFDTLMKLSKEAVAGGDVLFLPALNFLFLLGLIEYRAKNDVIEYVGPK